MKNKVNYLQATNFVNLFYTQQDKWNSKNEAEPKCESRSYFRSFVNHSYINRYIKADK